MQLTSINFKQEIPNIVIRIPDTDNVVLAGRKLKLYNYVDQEVIHTFTGHASMISIIKHFSINSKNYILTGSQSDRILSLWSLNDDKSKNAIASFLMENICVNLSCRVIDDEILKIGAVTRNGILHYFVEQFDDMKCQTPIKPKVTLEIVSNAKSAVEAIPAVAASIHFGRESDDSVLVGYGNKQLMRFEHFEISLKKKNQLEIRADPRKIKVNDSHDEKKFGVIEPIIQKDQIEFHTASSAIRKPSTKSVSLHISI